MEKWSFRICKTKYKEQLWREVRLGWMDGCAWEQEGGMPTDRGKLMEGAERGKAAGKAWKVVIVSPIAVWG